MMRMMFAGVLGGLWVCGGLCAADASAARTVEAERHVTGNGEAMRDARASEGRCAALLLDKGGALASAAVSLPAGDYTARFWLEVVPVEIIHSLAVTLQAGGKAVTLGQIQFDPRRGYRPFPIAFSHAGGPCRLGVRATGESGFDGMRQDLSEQERAGLAAFPQAPGGSALTDRMSGGGDADGLLGGSALDLLEEERDAQKIEPFDHHVLCDRIDIEPRRAAPVTVTHVEVDKVHYAPGETVRATARVRRHATAAAGEGWQFVAEDVSELDERREVYRVPYPAAAPQRSFAFSYALGDQPFGHALVCSVRRGDRVLHSAEALFGVSRNVYRVGITGNGGPQDMRRFSADQADAIMAQNKARFANYFERFAWAPCDYSNLAPETEVFYSGQTQYPGSIAGFRNLLTAAHRVGVKGITYGKASAAGIEGYKTFQRHPEFFRHRPEGPAAEAMSVFYLERMLADDYLLHAKPSDGGWQHWASLWTDGSRDDTVVFGAEAVIDSIQMFGWDGIRWDGHFAGNHAPFLEVLRERYPSFVHGYNIAFANPKGDRFLPPKGREDDFHEVAAQHGLMMDESVRDWSHTNFSPGWTRAFYEALCREADYIKRIGGLPLFIVFDLASTQDRTFGVLCGLVAGQRYTYITSPGDFLYGPLPRFLTRYSAFIWDDTARADNPARAIAITSGEDATEASPWWRQSVWVRERGPGRKQLLINLLNPVSYKQFSNRVQPPPAWRHDVEVAVEAPEGWTCVGGFHASPDLPGGHVQLDVGRGGAGRDRVVLPELRTWSIVGLEYEGGEDQPFFAVTTPVAEARAIAEAREEERREKEEAAQRAKAQVAPSNVAAPRVPYYKDYGRSTNVDARAMAAWMESEEAGWSLRRNGRLDVHHARGAFSWLTPLESAVGLCGAGRCTPSWVDLVGFKLNRMKGCMDEYPDRWEALLGYDVLCIDNVHMFHFGEKRRRRAAAFVRRGGGLLYMGGYWNLSLGADHNSAIEAVLPVRVRKYRDVVVNRDGLPLDVVDASFFPSVDWSAPARAFTVDVSPIVDERARVLVKAGEWPAIVASKAGEGRVVTVLMNPHGAYEAGGAAPYWEWSQWPHVLADCVRWLGAGAEETVTVRRTRTVDPAKPMPEDLFMDAFDMDSAEFTAALKAARVNMVDSDSARLLLEAAVDNADKVADVEVLSDIAERALPFFDKSFATLGKKLVSADLPFIREAGYQFLGMAGDRQYRSLLEEGLAERERALVRAALTGLGRVGDPAAAPAVREYLRRGEERFLACTVLLRLGEDDVLGDALRLYEQGRVRRLRLKSGKGHIMDTLWGGVSFKLTKEARERAMAEYRKVLRLIEEVDHDLRFFEETVTAVETEWLPVLGAFFAGTETREVLPLAYRIVSGLPEASAATFRAAVAEAELKPLRLWHRCVTW